MALGAPAGESRGAGEDWQGRPPVPGCFLDRPGGRGRWPAVAVIRAAACVFVVPGSSYPLLVLHSTGRRLRDDGAAGGGRERAVRGSRLPYRLQGHLPSLLPHTTPRHVPPERGEV